MPSKAILLSVRQSGDRTAKPLLFFLIMICCFVASVDAANSRFTLVIDAGHGGHDAGAVGAVTKEKNLTLRFVEISSEPSFSPSTV